jgi:hypothetical protein
VAVGFECTLLELDLAGAALGVDVRQFPLRIPIPADRRSMLPAAQESLTARGLTDGSAFAPELRGLIEKFAGGRVAVAVLGRSRDRSHRARAVLGGRVAVVARQRGDVVRFTPVRPESAVREVLSMLPPVRPGPGTSVTVTAPVETPTRYLQAVRSPVSQADAILRRPRLGSGYVTVTAGKAEPTTVSWVDTDAGRYAAIPDDRGNVTYTPAGVRKLEQIVTHLVTRLT